MPGTGGFSIRIAATHATALFIGTFTLLNLLGDLLVPGFDANEWWIDLRPLPAVLGRFVLLPAAVLLIAYAVAPGMGAIRRAVTLGCAVVIGIASVRNIAVFYYLIARGGIRAGVPVPVSLIIAMGLALVVYDLVRLAECNRLAWRYGLTGGVVLAVWSVGFPLAQMFCFGKTDYRRPADVAVVFGARAYADGRPSDALADRVRTGCMLYRDGVVKKLLFSGGPGDGAVHETEAMRQMAVSLGVRDEDILVDPDGLNTARTVANTCGLFDRLGVGRIIAVSHFYHLPRVKMAYRRAGRDVFTVPAKETYTLTQMPYLIAREVAALWAYYLGPLVRVG